MCPKYSQEQINVIRIYLFIYFPQIVRRFAQIVSIYINNELAGLTLVEYKQREFVEKVNQVLLHIFTSNVILYTILYNL